MKRIVNSLLIIAQLSSFISINQSAFAYGQNSTGDHLELGGNVVGGLAIVSAAALLCAGTAYSMGYLNLSSEIDDDSSGKMKTKEPLVNDTYKNTPLSYSDNVRSIILPSSNTSYVPQFRAYMEQLANIPDNLRLDRWSAPRYVGGLPQDQSVSYEMIEAGQKGEIETLLINPTGMTYDDLSTGNCGEKIVIKLNGNGQHMEGVMYESALYANYLKVPFLIFNYPGVGRSTVEPRSFDELVDSAVRVVKYAQEELGYKSENITLLGYSLGGAVAIKAATKLLQHDTPVRLFADRTFKTLRDKIPLLGGLFLPKEWDVEVLEDYLNLPSSNKMAMNNTYDRVIPKSMALVPAVRKRLKIVDVHYAPGTRKIDEPVSDFISWYNPTAFMTAYRDPFDTNTDPGECTHNEHWESFRFLDIRRPILAEGESYDDIHSKLERREISIITLFENFISRNYHQPFMTTGHRLAKERGWI